MVIHDARPLKAAKPWSDDDHLFHGLTTMKVGQGVSEAIITRSKGMLLLIEIISASACMRVSSALFYSRSTMSWSPLPAIGNKVKG